MSTNSWEGMMVCDSLLQMCIAQEELSSSKQMGQMCKKSLEFINGIRRFHHVIINNMTTIFPQMQMHKDDQ